MAEENREDNQAEEQTNVIKVDIRQLFDKDLKVYSDKKNVIVVEKKGFKTSL